MHHTKNHGFKFVEFLSVTEKELSYYYPVAGSFAVVSCAGNYLMCYNALRQQWELPAGQREEGETSKDCAIRELKEETGQIVWDMKFLGLLKVQNILSGTYKFNPVYFTTLENLQPFVENNETTKIMGWNLKEVIGVVDEVDLQLINIIHRMEGI